MRFFQHAVVNENLGGGGLLFVFYFDNLTGGKK